MNLDRNPLRRPSDRLQTAARFVAAGLLVVIVLGSALVGTTTYYRESALYDADIEHGYRVTATVLHESTRPNVGARDGSHYVYRLAWYDREQVRHLYTFETMIKRPSGRDIPLWIDANGKASTKAPSLGRIVVKGVFQAITVFLYLGIFLFICYATFVHTLNRRRAVAWAKEWDAVEPQWRRQVL